MPRAHPRLALVALILLSLIAMSRLCVADFSEWDDPSTIARNPRLNPATISSIAYYWAKSELSLYIPLTYTVWGGLSRIAYVGQPDETGIRLNPSVFHTANVLLHTISAILVWQIMRSLVPNELAAWIAAAIFAIHPLQVEPVAWASGTKDVLCAMFGFAAILAFIHHRKDEDPRLISPRLILATAALLAACLSKPTGVVVPVIALIIDVIIFRTPPRKSMLTLWNWFLIATIFGLIAKSVQPVIIANPPPLYVRPLIVTDSISFYLWKLVWPARLAIDYGRTPARAIAQGWIAFTWIAPAIIATLLIIRRRSPTGRTLIAAALIALVGTAPTLGFFTFQFQAFSTVADHYLYISMAGVALAIAIVLAQLDSRVAYTIATIVVLACAIQTFRTTAHWQNSDTLFRQATAVNPDSAAAHTNWAVSLARRNQNEPAIEHLRAAIKADPDYGFSHMNLAGLLLKSGHRDEALAEYRELLRVYQMQRNADPSVVEGTKRLIETLSKTPTSRSASPEVR